MKVSGKWRFQDNSQKFINSFNDCSATFLEEAKDSLVSATQRNTPVDTGDLKRSFGEDSYVDKDNLIAYIGSSKKYSVWVERGTGEYAIEGNGRKGGWIYRDEDGTHFTHGMKPKLMLYKAYLEKKKKISQEAGKRFARLNYK